MLNIVRAIVAVTVIANGYMVAIYGPRSHAVNLFAALFGLMVLVWSYLPRKKR